MRYTIRFLPEVEEDLVTGYEWYEYQAPGLGDDFLQMFYASIDKISLNPLSYPDVYHGVRRCLLKRFPYAIYFHIRDNDVIIFGLFHCARNPHFVRKKLRNRDKQRH